MTIQEIDRKKFELNKKRLASNHPPEEVAYDQEEWENILEIEEYNGTSGDAIKRLLDDSGLTSNELLKRSNRLVRRVCKIFNPGVGDALPTTYRLRWLIINR